MSSFWSERWAAVGELLRPEPVQVLHRIELVRSDLERAEAAQAEALTLPWYRPVQRWALRQEASRFHARAVRQTASARHALGPHGVGAQPGVWGVLSGAPRFHLEDTLQEVLLEPVGGEDLDAEVRRLLRVLPQVRLHAYRGDRRGEAQVRNAVRGLAARMQEEETHRRLIEHLPVEDRPQVSSVHELMRQDPPVTFLVSDCLQTGRDWPADSGQGRRYIALYDVVVQRDLAGLGLGTAALRELCRHADEAGMPIVVETMYPGPGYADLDTRIPRLARWYARHGFQAGSLPPEQWEAKQSIVRQPRTLGRDELDPA